MLTNTKSLFDILSELSVVGLFMRQMAESALSRAGFERVAVSMPGTNNVQYHWIHTDGSGGNGGRRGNGPEGTGKGGIPKGFEKLAKSANDISKKAKDGKIKYASGYHGRLGKEKELEILSNPDAIYVAGNNSQNLIYSKGGNVVIVESKGSGKGNTITSYGQDGARGKSGAAIFGGEATDPGMPVTHDIITKGVPTPSGENMPPAIQIFP